MSPLTFDCFHPDFALIRRIILQRLRDQPEWNHLDQTGDGFRPYVTFDPPTPQDWQTFAFLSGDVMWQLIIEGVIAPGKSYSNPNLPHFHVTAYGRRVLDQLDYQPHDPLGYLRRLKERIANPDPTVVVYLDESLNAFIRGSLVASMVMLGVAAERVFDLVCESLVHALANVNERADFERILDRYAMKPKLDWAHEKLRQVQSRRPRPEGFPDNTTLMVMAIYDLMRAQRNDLGHPNDEPPRIGRGNANANLEIFPRYYETAARLRTFLAKQKI